MKRMLALVAAGLLAALATVVPDPAAAGSKVRVTFSTTSPAMWYNEMTIGAPKAQGGLGFYEEEGLEVEFTGSSGSTAAVQLVGAGQADVGGHVGTAPAIIGVDQGLPVIFPWLVTRKNVYAIIVPEESRFTKVADLKGQKLGVFSLGSDGVPMGKAMAREAGLDPEKDLALVPIGLGAQAVNAIRSGQVVGGSFWDTGIALMETQGIKFRYLVTPGVDRNAAYSSGYVVNTNWLKNNRADAVKFFRAIAKAAVFIQTNTDASIKVHWKLYPTSKAADVDEAIQLRNMRHVMNARLRSLKPLADTTTKFGQMDPAGWEAALDFYQKAGLIAKKVPADRVFTNDLIAEANEFDHERIIRLAKEYR
jgi:NitT/TauT family transport system substrate-binding protein